MFKRFIAAVLVVYPLLAHAEERTAPCQGCQGKTSQASKGEDSRGGRICPLWEADYPESGFILYYCDRFQTSDCSDTPSACYWEGYHDWPCLNCTNCIEARLDKVEQRSQPQQPRQYRGFAGGPKSLNFAGPELKGPAGRFSQVFLNPRLQFIKRRGSPSYAKVFAVTADIGLAMGEPGGKSRTFYLAYEVGQAPPADTATAELDWEPIDQGNCHAFSATFAATGQRPISILVLTASDNKAKK